MLKGLELDPLRGCLPGANGVAVSRALKPREALPLPAPPASPAAGRPFSFRRAVRGAGFLQQMFVPISLTPASVGDETSLVVNFDVGKSPKPGKSREDYLRKFAESIAAPYCSELAEASGDDAPKLDFTTEEPNVLRRWNCDKGQLSEPFHASVRKFSHEELRRLVGSEP